MEFTSIMFVACPQYILFTYFLSDEKLDFLNLANAKTLILNEPKEKTNIMLATIKCILSTECLNIYPILRPLSGRPKVGGLKFLRHRKSWHSNSDTKAGVL